MGHFLMHWLGLDNASGPQYLFLSGVGSDLGYLGVAVALWKKFNCHEPHCWRIGRHAVDGTPWCNNHHGLARDGGLAFKKLRDKTPLPPS